MKKNSGVLIVLVLIVAALFALNPSSDDFKNYTRKQLEDGTISKSSIGGSLGAYERKNYGVFSVFYITLLGEKNDRHLGVAKMFIKLDE